MNKLTLFSEDIESLIIDLDLIQENIKQGFKQGKNWEIDEVD